jgi:branched-chain amino acid transport system ATP-binding protein
VLDTVDVTRRFGGVVAVNGVSLSVAEGELHGLIGPNGAGKSTLFHLVTGHLRPTAGVIRFQGQEVTRLAPHRRARLGIAIAFQAVRLFRGMTVLENVMVGANASTGAGFVEAGLRWAGTGRRRPRSAARPKRPSSAPA